MSSQALCSSKITTGAHSLVGRGFLPWAEFNCFVGLDAVVRFSHGDPGPRCSVGARTCGLRRAAQAPIAWPCRTSAPDMVGRGIGPRDNLGSQGRVAPRTHGPLLVQGRIATGIAACALAERRVAKTKKP